MRGRYGRSVQLVPKTLEVLREKVKQKHGYMGSFAYPINLSNKYVKKVKLNLNDNPNIFFEIIELQENGGSGGIQGGRSWQPFVGGKNGHENICQARIYNFRDK